MKQSIVLIAFFWSFGIVTTFAKTNIISASLDTLPPIQERFGNFMSGSNNPIDLHDPAVVDQDVEYDPETGLYIVTEMILHLAYD